MDVNPPTGILTPFRINDPVLRYQLDPCEPGMLRNASASQSIAAVSAHERGNLNQFRREAALAGRMVVQESITFTRAIDGIFASIQAGRTEVVTVPMPDRSPETVVVDSTQTNALPAVAEDTESSLEKEEMELLAELSSINRHIAFDTPDDVDTENELPSNPDSTASTLVEFPDTPLDEIEPDDELAINSDDEPVTGDVPILPERESSAAPFKVEEKDSEKIEILPAGDDTRYREELQEIQDKLNELMLKRMQANIAQLNEVLTGVIQQNIDLLSGLIQVANRIGPGSQFQDLSNNVALLGVTLDFTV